MDLLIDGLLLVLIGIDFGLLLASRIKEKARREAVKPQPPDEETLRKIRQELKKAEQWESLMNYNAQTYRREMEDEDG